MCWQAHAEGIILTVHAQPGAKSTQAAGLHGDALKIRVQAPPVDGKANAALADYLATQLGVAKSAVSLLSGESARRKRFLVHGDVTAVQRSVDQLIHSLAPKGG